MTDAVSTIGDLPLSGSSTNAAVEATQGGSAVKLPFALTTVRAESWIIRRDLTAAPASPAEGDRYIVAVGATGSWMGLDGRIVQWCLDGSGNGNWYNKLPAGVIYDLRADEIICYNGTTWLEISTLFSDAFDAAGAATAVLDTSVQKSQNLSDLGDLGIALSNLGGAKNTDLVTLRDTTLIAKGPVSFIANDPDVSPSPGMRRLIGISPTGVWVGKENQVAEYFSDGWHYSGAPSDGQLVYDQDTKRTYKYQALDGAWKKRSGKSFALSEFANLAAAIAFFAALTTPLPRLVIDEDVSLVADTVFAMPVKFSGGVLTTGVYDATFSAGVSASYRDQIFDADGTGAITAPNVDKFPTIWFDADPSGTDDSTAAWQRCADTAVANSVPFFGGKGTFKLSDKVSLAPVNLVYMSFIGAGFGTNVIQTADNAPVFQLDAAGLSHDNMFANFKVTFSAAADATKTKRCFIYCPSTGGTDFFSNTIENIFQLGGHYILRTDGPSFWGNRCVKWTAGGAITNGILYAIPDHSTGQPNNKFDHVYFSASATQSGTGLFVTQAFENCRIDNLELNFGGNVPVINDQSGCSYSLGEFRTEHWTYNNGAANVMFKAPANGVIRFDRCRIFNDIDGASTRVTAFSNGNSADGSYIHVNELVLNCTVTNGATGIYVASATGPDFRAYNGISIGKIVGLSAANKQYLVDNDGTSSADYTTVTTFNDESYTSWNADADLTLDGTENCTQIFQTWTSSHKVKLPNTFSFLLFTGRRYVFVKTAATTSDLNIYLSDGSTLVGTIAAASFGRMTVIYNRGRTNATARSWTVIQKTTW